MARLGYALYMAAMGVAGGLLVNVVLVSGTFDVWSEPIGLVLAGGAGLIGFVGGFAFYDDYF